MTPSGPSGEDPRDDPTPARRPRRRARVVAALMGLVVLGGLAVAALWYHDGGRWQVVATPSMGTAAPVGTLVLTEPATSVAVGDVVTYRPPVPNHPRTVTHRVISVEPDGGFRTRGDINGAEDPWTAHPSDLVGVVSTILPGLGWLTRATPLLVAGFVLVWFVTRYLMPWRWGLPARVLGYSVVVGTAITMLKPFVGAVILGTGAGENGTTRVTLVSTGLLPIRATAESGGSVDLVDGQVGLLVTQLPPEAKGAVVTTGVHMPIWLWIVMTLVWLVPMFYGLFAAWRRPVSDPVEPPAPPPGAPWASSLSTARTDELYRVSELTSRLQPARSRLRFDPLIAVAIGAAIAFVVSMAVPPTSSTFTASVANTTNTAGSAQFFSCAAALSTVATPYFVWPLDDTNVATLSTARDSSTNNRTGTYTNAFTTSTTAPCARDTQRSVTLAPTALLPSYVATSSLTSIASANVFSTAIWFRTTTTTGGKFMGWGNLRTLQSTTYDRHLYMTNSGQVVFGVYPGVVRTITSPKAYNDGQWHLAVSTLSSAGMVLYVDGAPVAADPSTTTAEGGTGNQGYWRVGWDNLNTWTSRPTTDYWTGSLADAAVYNGTALTAAQVAQIYGARN